MKSDTHRRTNDVNAVTVTIAKWTTDEYHRMIAAGILDNRRVELLRGEIVELLPESGPHAYFSSEAGEYHDSLVRPSNNSPQ